MIKHDPAECQKLIAEARETMREDDERINQLNSDKQALADQLEAACAEVARIPDLKAAIAYAIEERDAFEAERDSLRQEVAKLKALAAPWLPEEVVQLTASLLSAEALSESRRKALARELEENQPAMADLIAKLETERDSLCRQLESIGTTLYAVSNERDRLKGEVSALRQQLEAAPKWRDLYYAEDKAHDDTERDLAAAQRRIDELESIVQQTQGAHVSWVERDRQARERIAELEAERDSVRRISGAAPHDATVDAVRSLMDSRDRMETDRATLRRRVAELEVVHAGDLVVHEAYEERIENLELTKELVSKQRDALKTKAAELEEHSDTWRSRSQELAAKIAKLEADAAEPVGCAVHAGVVHGGEAEELRKGIEKLLADWWDSSDPQEHLHNLLEEIDARDSLAHSELSKECEWLRERVTTLETKQAKYNEDWLALRSELDRDRSILRATLPVYRAVEGWAAVAGRRSVRINGANHAHDWPACGQGCRVWCPKCECRACADCDCSLLHAEHERLAKVLAAFDTSRVAISSEISEVLATLERTEAK